MSVKVGLYNSPVGDENAVSFAETTVSAADLYDATGKQNKVKIVTLTAPQPDLAQTLYLRTTPMQGGETVKDVHPLDNVLPVRLVGRHLLGDANVDKRVDHTDMQAIISHISGKPTDQFNKKTADVNGDGKITIADIIGIVNIMKR